MQSQLIKWTMVALAALGMLSLAIGCGGSSSAAQEGGDGSGGKLTLVAYSTPEEAYKELIPAFNKTPEGKGVGFSQSYAASGEQSRAVESGLPADVVEFSLEPDMTRLVDADLVDKSWNANEHKGNVTNSVVVLMVRKGNPKNIKDWDDLVTGKVDVLEPNPFTSGGAKWNIMAAYGAQLEKGRSPPGGGAVHRRPVQERIRARQERRASRLRPSRAARGTCCSATRTRRYSPSRRARTSTTSCPTRRS
jgi:sulfate transport system substrate-binding protein